MTDEHKKGHVPTEYVKGFMPDLLNNSTYETEDGRIQKKYKMILSMGRGWQEKQWQNRSTYNVFKGEPETGDFPENLPGLEDSAFELKGLKWDITYNFLGNRDNYFGTRITANGKVEDITYGEADMSMDRLYYILVNAFNGGQDFVQFYLSSCMPYRIGEQVRDVVEPALEAYKEYVDGVFRPLDEATERSAEAEARIEAYRDVLYQIDEARTKSGKIRKNARYHGDIERWRGKALSELEEKAERNLQNAYKARLNANTRRLKFTNDLSSGKIRIKGKTWETESERLSDILRDDFVECMKTGIVPLCYTSLSSSTVVARLKAGLPPSPRFFASGQFARSINFMVRVY